MNGYPRFPVPFRPPNPAEAHAFRTVCRYLTRTANAVGTKLLQPGLARDETLLLDTVREQAEAGAALCEGLLDLTEGLDRSR